MDFSQLYLGKKFAQGSDSKIYRGIYSNKQVAVKILQHDDQPEDYNTSYRRNRIQKQFDSEVNILSRLCHDNVVELVASCSKTPVYFVLTEFCAEGSLRSYLSKFESCKTRLSLDKIIGFGLDIARGMEYVHSQGVIHRDIKPDNVLIDQSFRLKVADFGVSCQEKKIDSERVGTLRWMAPEMVTRKKYDRKVDVYSFGLILYHMVSGGLPFGRMFPYQVAYAVAHKNLRPEIPEDCPRVIRELIERCCCKNPKVRPEFSEIVKVLEGFDGSQRCSSIRSDNKKGFSLCYYLKRKFCFSV